jgi:putative tricarboxylic transport membrane protein
MIQSGGDLGIFLERPIALGLLAVAAVLLLLLISPTFRANRKEIGAT